MPCLTRVFLGEGSPTKIDCSKRGTLILTSPLEDLEGEPGGVSVLWFVGAHVFVVWI